MKVARGLILSAVVLTAAVLWYLYQPAPEPVPASATRPTAVPDSRPASLPVPTAQPESPPEPADAPAGALALTTAAPSRPGASRVLPIPGQRPPSTVPESETIQSDLDHVRYMVRDYRSLLGENPVGNNAEIMKALMGGNKKGAQLGPPEGQKLNGQGELVDRWGTPYFFHQLSKTDMEIRSAGPDRVMWTADDQVTK